MMAVELDADKIEYLFSDFAGPDTTIETDLETFVLKISGNNKTADIPFVISAFDFALVKDGGWVNYADAKY